MNKSQLTIRNLNGSESVKLNTDIKVELVFLDNIYKVELGEFNKREINEYILDYILDDIASIIREQEFESVIIWHQWKDTQDKGGIEYRKRYDNPIDNYIAMKEENRKMVDEILRKQKEKKELEKKKLEEQKAIEEQKKALEKEIDKMVEKAIEKAIEKLF